MPATGAISLTTPLRACAEIPAPVAEDLATLGLTNTGRLLAHLPMRHEKHEAEAPISELAPEQIVSARGVIGATRPVLRGRSPRFQAILTDGTGRLDLVWFNAMYMRDKIHPGMRMRVQGKARRYKSGLQIANPSFTILRGDEPEPTGERLRSVYPASERVSTREIERAIATLLPSLLPLIEDHLPEAYRRERELPTLADAYRMFHAPESMEDVSAAHRRLAYDELLLLQLGVHMKRMHLRGTMKAPAMKWSEPIDRHIRERFPFALTPAQDSVVADLVRDLTSDTPTNRLIQGDVGSGKTVVALYAMLLAVASGHQGAIMAPTEILAEQHWASITRMLEGSRVRIELLTGSTPEMERESILARTADGRVDILVGTHALLTESVRFSSLGVAIIDEQHRFGVHQRASLRAKATSGTGPWDARTPHVLVMTATPIPRTLAITLFGDLDISTINALPPGRRPVATSIVGPEGRDRAYEVLRQRLDRGEQAFIVLPAIDGSDDEERPVTARSVRTHLKWLEEGPLRGKRLCALHGRLKGATRDHIMERFRAGMIDALVTTTVIEVGVDVPNASVMIVESADRFGLAQLHQLRGRVGRGTRPSACVLIADAATEEARRRLDVMKSVKDGFTLAEKDLEIRGPGELFGTRQSGMPPFKVADLSRDLDLLKMARRDASEWIAQSPALTKPGEALLLRRLLKAHGQWLGIGDVG